MVGQSGWAICDYEGHGPYCTLKVGLEEALKRVRIPGWWGKGMLFWKARFEVE